MKSLYLPIILVLLTPIYACTTGQQPADQSDLDEIRHLMNLQMEAWNRGDIESFMEAYWNSAHMRFSSSAGTTHGYRQLLKGYQKSFNTKESMGTLTFRYDSMYTDRPPYVQVEGRWTIHRMDTIGGRFVLTFQKIEKEGWKIIEDHTW